MEEFEVCEFPEFDDCIEEIASGCGDCYAQEEA